MKPFLSVIIPCRNEAAFLSDCLDSILRSDYPADRMEVVIADGMSTDGTRHQIDQYARLDARIRIVDNPERITPVALNRAIQDARGDIIVRLDAHSTIGREYLSRAVASLESSGADNVGGPMRTIARDSGPFSRPIQIVLTHRFGVGNSHFRTSGSDEAPRWVDTVFGGCWRREIFQRVGNFNERLVRSQDMEFSIRLRRSGGRILLDPSLAVDYFARATLRSFLHHNWINGVWAVLPFAYSSVVPVRLRHLIPMAFAAALGIAFAAALLAGWWWMPAAVAGPYAAASVWASAGAAVRHRQIRLLFLLPVAFASLHLAYGAGSLWGAVRLAGVCLSRLFSASPALAIRAVSKDPQ